MQKPVLFGVLSCVAAMIAVGCGDSGSAAASPKEKADFGGGAMPEKAKEQFQKNQQANQVNAADMAAKAKAAAGH